MDSTRDETAAERYDRNWLDLIQELRVAQTGIQVLAGFLLTVPFTYRFGDIADHARTLFLVAFGLAVLTIGLMVAPVAMHRFLFGRHQKDVLVRVGDRIAKLGLVALGLTLVAVTALIFDVVVSAVAGVVAGVVVLVFYALVWVALPMSLLRQEGSY
jgi:Family of unknown function (DUF6328)